MSKKAALLVLNYNAERFLEDCLDSLLSQSCGNFEIFLIDNNSTDGSVGLVRENYSPVKIIENRENLGVGRGFNGVIKKIQNDFDYIGLFNPDIRLDKNWLREAVSTLEESREAEVCAGLIYDWEGKEVDTAGGRIINLLAGVFGGFLGERPKEDFPVFFAVVTAMLVRANTFKNFGLFDEDYFMYFEDIDFCWRVLLAGGRVLCNPQAIAFHYGHGSKPAKEVSVKIHGLTEVNLLTTYFKNLSGTFLILLLLPLLLVRMLASFLYLLVSPGICGGKLRGIGRFVLSLFSPQLWQKRRMVQKLRKVEDFEVLKNNPAPLFSLGGLWGLARSWLKVIRRAYDVGD